MKYIYETPDWFKFQWNLEKVTTLLTNLKFEQGKLIGKMNFLGLKTQNEALVTSLTESVVKSSMIEEEVLNDVQVRSSIARKLGMDYDISINIPRNIDGVTEIILDATQNYNKVITHERLYGWNAALFPTGYSNIRKILVGTYRQTEMSVVSGGYGKEKIHFQAPAPTVLYSNMGRLIEYMNHSKDDDIIKSAIVHLWFLTLHPFENGNGRIARALSDLFIARADNTKYRFYSMSSQICKNRKSYYSILEKTQKGSTNITEWIEWFIENLHKSVTDSENLLGDTLLKSNFWQKINHIELNTRQRKMINKLLDNFEGNMTTLKWAKICKVSQDTATKDINDLIAKNIIKKLEKGKNTHYILN